MNRIHDRTYRELVVATMVIGFATPASAQWDDIWGGGAGTNNTIMSMTSFNGDVIAAGPFTMAGGVAANSIASWDGVGWSALGSGLQIAPEGVDVHDLVVYGGKLIAAGDFRQAGGTAIRGVASWDGVTWESLGTGLRDDISSLDTVRSLATDSSPGLAATMLYAGGSFETMDGDTVSNFSGWDGANWTAVGGGVNGHVNAIVSHSTGLYVGGAFSLAGGVTVSNLARWTGDEWESPDGGTTGEILSLGIRSSLSGDQLLVGGRFLQIDSPLEVGNRFAAYNLARDEWETPGTDAAVPGFNGDVYDIGILDGAIYAVGGFTESAIGAQLNYIALRPANDDPWTALFGGLDNHALALLLLGESVYVGGEFLSAGGMPSTYIASIDRDVTPVSLASFTASRLGRDIVVRWLVGPVSDHAGFHVHRGFGSGPDARLTASRLTGRGAYSFTDQNPPLGDLRYWLEEVDVAGRSQWHGPVSPSERPPRNGFAHLGPVAPNPASDTVVISYSFEVATSTRILVHDARGRTVATLYDGVAIGTQSITWDGRTANGDEVTDGVYFVSLLAGGREETRKLVWAR